MQRSVLSADAHGQSSFGKLGRLERIIHVTWRWVATKATQRIARVPGSARSGVPFDGLVATTGAALRWRIICTRVRMSLLVADTANCRQR